jgi:hypothetical protein
MTRSNKPLKITIMKWNDLFFNTNFTDSLQKGVDEFSRLSGYKIAERKPFEKSKKVKRTVNRFAWLLYFLIAALFVTFLLNSCH